MGKKSETSTPGERIFRKVGKDKQVYVGEKGSPSRRDVDLPSYRKRLEGFVSSRRGIKSVTNGDPRTGYLLPFLPQRMRDKITFVHRSHLH